MSRNFYLLLMASALSLASCRSRTLDYTQLSNRVRISTSESSTIAALSAGVVTRLKDDRFYSWYDKGIIGSTQGGYSGKLLHGDYTSHYSGTKQLSTKGEYKMGLKTGKWKRWDTEGNLLEVQRWRKGKLLPVKVKRSLKSRIMKMVPFKSKLKK